ncbi:MAG: hypothetical protein IPO07_30095 [Haliscomenobacter sp.]|nr:hypothetical protein [Haliscomenobacter sp.]MBK9492566.1 hypothetical protein [Haliscomenobacter sp.]
MYTTNSGKEQQMAVPFYLIKRKYPSGLVKFAVRILLHWSWEQQIWMAVNLIMNFFYPLMQHFWRVSSGFKNGTISGVV